MTMVNCSLSSVMSSSTFAVAMGSRAEQGSSMRMILGWTAMVRAMQRRCCCPPDSPRAESLRRSLTSSQRADPRRLRSTASSRVLLFLMPWMRSP